MNQFVIAITVATDALGTTETHYFTDGPGFATRPTDTPANTYIAPRIINPGNIRRELFSGNRLYGAVRPSFGEIVLSNADGAFDNWLGYGIDGRPITIWWGPDVGAFPDDYSVVLKVYGHSLIADFDTLRVRVRDRLQMMDKPFCNRTLAGTGGLEGDSTMAGKLMPRVSSDPVYYPVQLVEPFKLIYLVHSGSPGSLSSSAAIYEGGVLITRGADYSSATDMLNTAPSPGTCRWLFNGTSGPTYVRLGSTPVYELRASCSGYNASGGMINLAQEAGIADAMPGPYAYRYVDDETTILQLAEDGAKMGPYFFGFTRLDTYQAVLLQPPSATASYTFTQHNAFDFQRMSPEEMPAPAWKIVYRAGEQWPATCVDGAGQLMHDALSRKVWWTASYEDSSILTKHPGAVTIEIDDPNRAIQSAFGWSQIRDRYIALFFTERDFITLTAPFSAETLALDLHDTVEVRLPRFGLNAGKKFRIVSMTMDLAGRKITYGLWG